MTRRSVSANRPWEAVVGYARAVRVGNVIEVSGTAAAGPDGTIVHKGDVEGQAREALRTIVAAIEELGGSASDVVRTRVLLLDASRWEQAGRAHGEVFADIRPANTTMAVAGFIDPGILVEIEATALVDEQP